MSEADRAKWDERWRSGSHGSTTPSPFLVRLAEQLPATGRALDVAGGAGRNALWLAQRGLDVTVADISEVGLALARERAAAAGIALRTISVDLATQPLPRGPWDLIVCIHYLERALFRAIAAELAPTGCFVFLQPTVRNLERHPRPPRDFLLAEGELAGFVPAELAVVELEEGWSPEGFHEARLLARRRAASS